jgi:hypothetical protein
VQTAGKYYVEQYVIPVLSTIIRKGVGSVDDLKEELTPLVMAAKKVDMLAIRATNLKL